MEKVSNYIQIKSNSRLKMSPEGDFFRVWVAFLEPVHKLTGKEMEVLAEYLKERYELSKKISDNDTIDKVLMSFDTRKIICNRCDIKGKHLNVILSKFRKNGVIKDGKIYLNLMPVFNNDGAGLMIYFNFKDDDQQLIKLGPAKSKQRA